MAPTFRVAATALCLLFCAGTLAAQQPDLSALDRMIADSLPGLGGRAAVVIVRDDRILFSKGYGGLSIDAPVRLGSASSWISAATMLSVVGDNLLSLDDTVGRFFPGVSEEVRGITLRQLLAHTSSIVPSSSKIGAPGVSLAASAEAILVAQLEAPPGSGVRVGDGGLQVAGRIAEIAAGLPWDTLVARRLARPLGITTLSYRGTDETANPPIATGAAMSSIDLARFLTMVVDRGSFEGRQILRPLPFAAMLADQSQGAPLERTPWRAFASLDPDLASIRPGLGLWRERVASGSEPLEIGVAGSTGVGVVVDLGNGFAALLATESSLQAMMPTWLAMRALLRDRLARSSGVDREWIGVEMDLR